MRKYLTDFVIIGCLILFFICFALIFIPINYSYIFNYDESNAIVLADILDTNYKYYDEVWTDHPIGFSLLLHQLSRFSDLTLPYARKIVLFISGCTLTAFYFLLRLFCDRISSVLATLILMTSFQYIILSTSVLKEIPSICLVIVCFSLLFIAVHKNQPIRYWFYFITALCLVLSLEVKLSGVTAIPSLIGVILLSKNSLKQKLLDSTIFVVFIGLIFVLLTVTIFPFSVEHIIGTHTEASSNFQKDPLTLGLLLKTTLIYEPIFYLLTVVSIFFIIRSKHIKTLLIPLSWLLFTLLRFATLSPVWPNYYLHIIIPFAWIIGLFLHEINIPLIWQELQNKNFRSRQLILRLIIIIPLLLQLTINLFKIVINKNPFTAQYIRSAKNYKIHPIESLLQQYEGTNKTILTDNPYYIHKFNLQTPPETAILSRKRMVAENINGDFIAKIIEKRMPDFVFIYRYENKLLSSPQLINILKTNYVEYPMDNARGKMFISKIN